MNTAAFSKAETFDFANPRSGEGASARWLDGIVAVRLAECAWAYGCAIAPLSEMHPSGVLDLEVKVDAGDPSIGILTLDGSYFYDEIQVSNAKSWRRISLKIPEGTRCGDLIVRNTQDSACRVMLKPLSFVADGNDDILSAKAAALDRLLAASRELMTLTSRTELPPQWQSVLGQALEKVAPFADVALLGRGDASLMRSIDRIDDETLKCLAQAMVVPAAAGARKGWTFDGSFQRLEPEWQLKAAVWRAMKQRCPDALIAIPWLEGTTVLMPLGSDLSVPLFMEGRFEPNIFQVIAPMIGPGDVVIDVGANEGLYSLLAAARVGPQGRVVAVEPSPREFARLRANVDHNKFGDRVILFDKALSSAAGWAPFVIAEASHAGQNAFADRFTDRIIAEDLRQTPVATLDALAAKLISRRVNLVKIDVEGAEFDVMLGSEILIEHHRPTWIIEVGRSGEPADHRVTSLLRGADYRLFCIDDETGSALALESDSDVDAVHNILAIPREELGRRWRAAPPKRN